MPNAKTTEKKKSSEPIDTLYSSDAFRMYCFKVLPCTKKHNHNWKTCPFAHEGEKARRRDPRVCRYVGIECPDGRDEGKGCPRGNDCPFAHSVFEYWLHPTRYRTQMCNEPATCKRKVCFFAHSLEELREPSLEESSPKVSDVPLPKIETPKPVDSPREAVSPASNTSTTLIETSLLPNEGFNLSGHDLANGVGAFSAPPNRSLSDQFSFGRRGMTDFADEASQNSSVNQFLLWQAMNALNSDHSVGSVTHNAVTAPETLSATACLGLDLRGRISPPSPNYQSPPRISVDLSSESGSIYAGWNSNSATNLSCGSLGEEAQPSLDILNHLAQATQNSQRMSADFSGVGLSQTPGFGFSQSADFDVYTNRRLSVDGYLARDPTSIW